ncbi:MAG TPA: hypothetical protein VFX49_20375, partial [Chloroflexota bacterium]|nr:hypothetical protein [Chloroflexota bacterium]
MALLFVLGYVYGRTAAGARFTSALFTAVLTTAGNTFQTAAGSFTVASVATAGQAGSVQVSWTGVAWS